MTDAPVADHIRDTCLIVNYHSRTSSGAAAFTTEAKADAYILEHCKDWQIGLLMQRVEYVSGRITFLLLRLINLNDVSVLCRVYAATPGFQTVELPLGDIRRPETLPVPVAPVQGVPGRWVL